MFGIEEMRDEGNDLASEPRIVENLREMTRGELIQRFGDTILRGRYLEKGEDVLRHEVYVALGYPKDTIALEGGRYRIGSTEFEDTGSMLRYVRDRPYYIYKMAVELSGRGEAYNDLVDMAASREIRTGMKIRFEERGELNQDLEGAWKRLS